MQVSRGGWALTVLSSLIACVLTPDLPRLIAEVTGPSFPDALVALASLLALGLAGWALVVIAIVTVGAPAGLVLALTPGLLRRAVLVGAAGALVAAPVHAEQQVSPQAQPRHSVSGLPLPDRPAVVSTGAPSEPATDAVAVRPGDTLWAIAARSLPDRATDAEIARATARWHDANREVIGDDPDLIFPTQRLVPPTGKDHP